MWRDEYNDWKNKRDEIDDVIVDKLTTMLDDLEQKLTSTNSDYTAALRAAIGDFFGMFSNKCLHENNMDKLAACLNSVVKAQQNCA